LFLRFKIQTKHYQRCCPGLFSFFCLQSVFFFIVVVVKSWQNFLSESSTFCAKGSIQPKKYLILFLLQLALYFIVVVGKNSQNPLSESSAFPAKEIMQKQPRKILIQLAIVSFALTMLVVFGGSDILLEQLQGITIEFTKTTFPSSDEVMSLWSGMTGILYAAPAFIKTKNPGVLRPFGKCLWVMQGIFSILADYYYIGQTSIVHGIDRFLAVMNFFRLINLLVGRSAYKHAIIGVLPLGCHFISRRAKLEKDWALWQRYHGWWHIFSTIQIFWAYLEFAQPEQKNPSIRSQRTTCRTSMRSRSRPARSRSRSTRSLSQSMIAGKKSPMSMEEPDKKNRTRLRRRPKSSGESKERK